MVRQEASDGGNACDGGLAVFSSLRNGNADVYGDSYDCAGGDLCADARGREESEKMVGDLRDTGGAWNVYALFHGADLAHAHFVFAIRTKETSL